MVCRYQITKHRFLRSAYSLGETRGVPTRPRIVFWGNKKKTHTTHDRTQGTPRLPVPLGGPVSDINNWSGNAVSRSGRSRVQKSSCSCSPGPVFIPAPAWPCSCSCSCYCLARTVLSFAEVLDRCRYKVVHVYVTWHKTTWPGTPCRVASSHLNSVAIYHAAPHHTTPHHTPHHTTPKGNGQDDLLVTAPSAHHTTPHLPCPPRGVPCRTQPRPCPHLLRSLQQMVEQVGMPGSRAAVRA